MSCNRENVVWQRRDGTWCIGFYDYYPTGDTSSEDWDYEWDVEYTDDFMWAREGLASEQAAIDSWDGANPGSHTIYTYSPSENAQGYTEHFEELLAKLKAAHPEAVKPRSRLFAW